MPEEKVAIGKLIVNKSIKVTCPYCSHDWEEPYRNGGWQRVRDGKRSVLCPNCGNGISIFCPEVDW